MFDLKFAVWFEMFIAIVVTFIFLLASLGFYLTGRKNIKLYKTSENTIGYFRNTEGQSKSWLIFKGIFSIIYSIISLTAVPFYIYYILTPIFKDIPNLFHNKYSYTVGIIYNVQSQKESNIIFVNDLKLYESTLFSKGKLEPGKKYVIAFLNNTNQCVGFEELK